MIKEEKVKFSVFSAFAFSVFCIFSISYYEVLSRFYDDLSKESLPKIDTMGCLIKVLHTLLKVYFHSSFMLMILVYMHFSLLIFKFSKIIVWYRTRNSMCSCRFASAIPGSFKKAAFNFWISVHSIIKARVLSFSSNRCFSSCLHSYACLYL